VNVAGRVNLMVFDKTGTLTEDGLQVYGYRGVTKQGNNIVFDKFYTESHMFFPGKDFLLSD
jgi:magnesium-transporting ATPase (P-type)